VCIDLFEPVLLAHPVHLSRRERKRQPAQGIITTVYSCIGSYTQIHIDVDKSINKFELLLLAHLAHLYRRETKCQPAQGVINCRIDMDRTIDRSIDRYIYSSNQFYLLIQPAQQILALTLLHIHTLPGGPLPLLCSRAHAGLVLPHPPRTLPHSDTHSVLRDCDGRLLSLSPSLSLTRCWGAGSSSLADVERRKKER